VFALIVDLDTGFYVHRQGLSAVLMGGTDKDIKPGLDTEVDWDAFDAVFRAAALRVPPLAEARVMRAYAGVRDLTTDYHGILGPAAQAPGLHVACGFSGHGFMHAPKPTCSRP
jgi:sarcosine oxidase subunit beta